MFQRTVNGGQHRYLQKYQRMLLKKVIWNDIQQISLDGYVNVALWKSKSYRFGVIQLFASTHPGINKRECWHIIKINYSFYFFLFSGMILICRVIKRSKRYFSRFFKCDTLQLLLRFKKDQNQFSFDIIYHQFLSYTGCVFRYQFLLPIYCFAFIPKSCLL